MGKNGSLRGKKKGNVEALGGTGGGGLSGKTPEFNGKEIHEEWEVKRKGKRKLREGVLWEA